MIDIRSVHGLAEHFIGMIEAVDQDRHLSLEEKIRLSKQACQEVRALMALNLQYKNLVLKSPALAGDASTNLKLGKPA